MSCHVLFASVVLTHKRLFDLFTCFFQPLVPVKMKSQDGPKGIGCEVGFAILHPCLGLCSYSRSTMRIGTRWDTRTAFAHPTFIADVQYQKYCQSEKKKRRRGILEKMAHQTLSKKPAMITPHTFGNVAQKWFNQKKTQTNSKTPFLKTAAKLLTKEVLSVTLHVDTTPD